MTNDTKRLLGEGICVNTTAVIVQENDQSYKKMGSELECVILQFATELGYDYKNWRIKLNEICSFLFNSYRGMMTTVIKEDNLRCKVYTKGLPHKVIEKCTTYIAKDGKISDLTNQIKYNISNKILKDFSSKGMKTIAFAFKETSEFQKIDNQFEDEFAEKIENDLTLIAIMGIEDNIRLGVPGEILKCRNNNIDIKLITIENILTAKFIAMQSNILLENDLQKNPENSIIEGSLLEKYISGLTENEKKSQTEWRKVAYEQQFFDLIEGVKVVANATLFQKFLLINGLKKNPLNMIAVTGHEPSEVICLRKADIGIASDYRSTDIAKEAADIILVDNNISSIMVGINWGKSIFRSIQKFVQFQLTSSLSAIMIVMISLLIYDESILAPVHLLWILIITEIFGVFALTGDTNIDSNNKLYRRPFSSHDQIVTPSMIRNVIMTSICMCLIVFTFSFIWSNYFNISFVVNAGSAYEVGKLSTLCCNIFTWMITLNSLNCRIGSSEINIFSYIDQNYIFILGFSIISITQVLMIEYVNEYLFFDDLTINEHFITISIAISIILVGTLIKFIPESLFKICKCYDSDPSQESGHIHNLLRTGSIKRINSSKRFDIPKYID